MKRAGYAISLFFSFLLISGCLGIGNGAIKNIEQNISSTGKTLEPSVVLVTLEGLGGGTGNRRPKSSIRHTTGIVLDKEGHILVSDILKPDSVKSVEVWLEDEKYPAKIIKSNDNLRMTILKVDTDEKLFPLALEPYSELKQGEYSISIEPRGENEDFAKFYRINVCSGIVDGFYRRYKNNHNLSRAQGSPAVNLDGELVGIQLGNDIIAIRDIFPDLKEFIAEATNPDKNGKEEDKKSWLGAFLSPINKEYAKLMKLPKSGIWVNKVSAGTPAATAGLKEGDLIVGVNDRKLRFRGYRSQVLFNKILRPKVDTEFKIEVIRDNRPLVLKSTFTEKPEGKTLTADDLGVTVKEITDHDSFALNLFTTDGVLVTYVKKGSPAANSGSMRRSLLGRNFVITELGGVPTPDLECFTKALEKIRLEKPEVLLVRYWRGRASGYAGLNLKIGDQGNGAE